MASLPYRNRNRSSFHHHPSISLAAVDGYRCRTSRWVHAPARGVTSHEDCAIKDRKEIEKHLTEGAAMKSETDDIEMQNAEKHTTNELEEGELPDSHDRIEMPLPPLVFLASPAASSSPSCDAAAAVDPLDPSHCGLPSTGTGTRELDVAKSLCLAKHERCAL
uniref:Uncharacterized protein n=1 Tax=Leersia perrieri TaxID=77586 RepID=A0A0D9XN50_9ORYZ